MQLKSAKAIAEHLGISIHTVRRYARTGRMPCVRIGRRVLYDLAEIDIWVVALRVKEKPETG